MDLWFDAKDTDLRMHGSEKALKECLWWVMFHNGKNQSTTGLQQLQRQYGESKW